MLAHREGRCLLCMIKPPFLFFEPADFLFPKETIQCTVIDKMAWFLKGYSSITGHDIKYVASMRFQSEEYYKNTDNLNAIMGNAWIVIFFLHITGDILPV